MTSALFEFDEAGTPMGASWMFATPHDWARFGLLYLNDGVANGRRILPEGWVAYSASPTPQAEWGYGAGFWTNRGTDPGSRRRQSWGMPADAFFALGNSGQIVLVVPSARLVIVSLGFAVDPTNRPPVEAAARLTAAVNVW
jgi:CubicO group peptidase (beta-lactamase class C family)